MSSIAAFFNNKSLKIYGLLLLCSFLIYFFYFQKIFSNPNSVLSSITGDALKNYYTYAYHIKNDSGPLHFEGMNFPYGEHVIYTDCQPLLTFILRGLPFTHDYVIGILHYLIFLSFVITPLILFRIFKILEIDSLASFFISIAITLLSPQFAKINGGHHGLAYGCVIPIFILLILEGISKRGSTNTLLLFCANSLLFLLHPYLGLSTSVFSFLTFLFYDILNFKKIQFWKNELRNFVVGVLPVILFRLFMLATDRHKDRTVEPYGNNALVENPATILAPDFGPFQSLLEKIFPNKVIHYEGHSYLGLFTILALFLLLLALPFFFRRFVFKRETIPLLISGFILLMVSFGWHVSVLKALHINTSGLNQFRASCRFAWQFYYVLPLFLVATYYHTFKNNLQAQRLALTFRIFALTFFSVNFSEANSYFTKDSWAFWRFKNFFREELLSPEEKQNINHIKSAKAQAILPLPIAMVGSEMYDRIGGDNSMIPAMIYSYHCNMPILSGWMSRTSISETAEVIQLLNPWKKNKEALERIDKKDFIVVKSSDKLLPGEKRLLPYVKKFYGNDTLEMGHLKSEVIRERRREEPIRKILYNEISDTNGVVFISHKSEKPFVESNFENYEIIYKLDPKKFKSGNYVVSFHFYFKEKIYKSLACNLIVTKKDDKDPVWEYFLPMAILSGFYEDYAVFEYPITIDTASEYEFIIKGAFDRTYHISDFMLRPDTLNILTINGRDSIFNNYSPK